MLEPLGLTEIEEAVYRVLVRAGPLAVTAIAREQGVTRREALTVLDGLEAHGLVSKSAGDRPPYIAAPPDAALEVLLLRRREELERARLSIGALTDEFRHRAEASSPSHLVEVITGKDAIVRRFTQIQRTATETIRMFDTPPYASGTAENSLELQLLSRGIRYQVVYAAEALEQPGQPGILRALVSAGEEARLLPELPMRLAIADRTAALIPLRVSGPDTEEGDILIHRSPLLEAVATLFDVLWERAMPIRFAEGKVTTDVEEELSPDEQDLLALLAADTKDDVIARQLGIGRRSVQRRIQSLTQRVGARTRLQLVLLASRRGWI